MTSRHSQNTHRYRIPSSADHERISALFLGPKGENAEFLQSWLTSIVAQQKAARDAYFPDDDVSRAEYLQLAIIFIIY